MNISSFGEQSDTMQGLILEGNDMINRSIDPEVTDAAIIASIQYMKHFEIAGYGSVCAFAKELGLESIANQLHLTLEEEKATDVKLTELAKTKINKRAKTPIVM